MVYLSSFRSSEFGLLHVRNGALVMKIALWAGTTFVSCTVAPLPSVQPAIADQYFGCP